MNFFLSIVVFVLGTVGVLALLALIAWLTGLLDAQSETTTTAAPDEVPVGEATNSRPATQSGLSPVLTAVITAAVTTAMAGRPFRIQSIKMAHGSGPSTWAHAGRQTIHASHVIERKFK